ncbi:hypothetical protein ES705_34169 [subsurface metagenome]
MGIEEQFENRNMLDMIIRNRKIEAVLNKASNDLAMKAAIFEMKYPTKMLQGSFYIRNRGLEKQIDSILNKLNKDIQTNIQEGIVSHWDMANLKNNKLVGTWAKGIKLNKDLISPSFNQLNLAALDTFLNRTAAGMNLSERVWNLTNGAKDQLELYLASGISTGESAAEIAGNIKQYLNEPNRLFRRVRQEGKLVLSKAAKGYHPGAGIYRSSYKNALRLSKNEINMAYRMSDYTRRQQLPFVTGIEVHLSASHPQLDMCDDLVGKYPKGFIFMTWHVGCLCYTTSIMLNDKDSLKFMKTGQIDKLNYINRIPYRAQDWLDINAKTIAGYKNIPYWIRDNFTKDLILKGNIPTAVATIPGAPKTNMQLMRIKEFNKKYADAKIEHCIAVDTKGNIVLEKSGARNYVKFTPEEFNQMNVDNMLFTHNHPSGSSFSGDDLNMLGAYKRGTEIRAVGTKYEYSAKIIDSTKFPHSGAEVKDLFRVENSILQDKYQKIYNKERGRLVNTGIDYKEATELAARVTSQMHTHEAMEEFAKRFGIEYKRWLNK